MTSGKRPRTTTTTKTDEGIWFEVDLDEDWMAAYRLLPQRGNLVVAEVRIFPSPSKKPARGRWDVDEKKLEVEVPRGGLRARTIRQVKSALHLRHARETAPLLEKYKVTSLSTARAGIATADEPIRKSPAGRKRLPDSELARAADEYARAVKRGSPNPVAQAAKKLRLRESTVRARVSLARKRGLLTPSTAQGSVGGDITEKARKLLSRKGRKK